MFLNYKLVSGLGLENLNINELKQFSVFFSLVVEILKLSLFQTAAIYNDVRIVS